MNESELIATEQHGSSSNVVSFVTCPNNHKIVPVTPKKRFLHNFRGISNFFKEIILPYGYPDSVSEDYLEYQIWDTLQAFCSTIIGAFKTRAILKGVGVGDSEATALSAAITWILKDGIGMVGRILFTWWKGSGLDCDCKKWRFFADILNDAAMLVELCLPLYTVISMQILCVTSTMYAIVGIAGGATRASITHHQAVRDNMAEISAKDGSQETVVNLIGSIGSIYLLSYFTSHKAEWVLILLLMVLHLYANFLAVKSLTFKTFNRERLVLVIKTFFSLGTVTSPFKVKNKEAVLIGMGIKEKSICGFNIVLGQSMTKALNCYSVADMTVLKSMYQDKKYLLLVCGRNRTIYVCLEKGECSLDIIAAYFHAVCIGMATSIYNCDDLGIFSKRQLRYPTPFARLSTYMRSSQNQTDDFRNIPPQGLSDFSEFVKQELNMFLTALSVNGWKVDSHCLEVGEYRVDWKTNKKQV